MSIKATIVCPGGNGSGTSGDDVIVGSNGISGDDGEDLLFGDDGYDMCFGNNDFDADVLWMGGSSTCESKNSVEGSVNLP